MNIEFRNLSELYERLKPALLIKEKEFKKENLMISKRDIWQFLATVKWSCSDHLYLYQMVEDILHLPNDEILEFLSK